MRGKDRGDDLDDGTIWWGTKKEQSGKGEAKEPEQDRKE